MSDQKHNFAAYAQRKTVAAEPHIYFTLDYREVVEGYLRPGARCHLRYDPTRIPVEPGYAFGTAEEPVVAHVKFSDAGDVLDIPLHSKTGILTERDIDITGHGSTLDAHFTIPENAEKLIVWFSHHRANGTVSYDSRNGENFVFRFLIDEIRLVSATIQGAPHGATNVLTVNVAACPEVERVWLNYHVADRGVAGPEKHAPLEREQAQAAGGEQSWSAEIEVAYDQVVILDLAYEIGGRAAIDDNLQRHYLVFPPPS
jgi:hypothetical protein